MKEKTIYTDEPIGKIKVVPDFLPPPNELIKRQDTVKITLTLSKDSVNFFKSEAKKNRTQYQKMIRVLLDKYVQKISHAVG